MLRAAWTVLPTAVCPPSLPCPSAEACGQGVALTAYAEQSPRDDSRGLCSAPEPRKPSALSGLGGCAPNGTAPGSSEHPSQCESRAPGLRGTGSPPAGREVSPRPLPSASLLPPPPPRPSASEGLWPSRPYGGSVPRPWGGPSRLRRRFCTGSCASSSADTPERPKCRDPRTSICGCPENHQGPLPEASGRQGTKQRPSLPWELSTEWADQQPADRQTDRHARRLQRAPRREGRGCPPGV